jgi:hypothetical protein
MMAEVINCPFAWQLSGPRRQLEQQKGLDEFFFTTSRVALLFMCHLIFLPYCQVHDSSDCTALHCTALHCTALHCTALHCTALPGVIDRV